MALTLTIENFTSLPDGGPLTYTVTGARGFDVGRDTGLDWTLPDATRYISGKHCEVRYQDGDYVLYDVSTNGTFLNGSDRRMHGPHVLRSGDRVLIGNYIVVVTTDFSGGGLRPPPPAAPAAFGTDIWDCESAAPPASANDIVPRPAHRPIQPEFPDWRMALPNPEPPLPASAPESPRRSVWVDATPTGLWAGTDAVPGAPSPPPAHSPPPPQETEPEPPAAQPAPVWDEGPPVAPPEPAPPSAARSAPEADAAPSPPLPGGLSTDAALAAFARGAGLPIEAFSRRSGPELFEEIGATVRVVAENLLALLQARSSVKRTIRSSDYTTIAALDNNPFKFSPTAEDALRIAFGPPTRSYLSGRTAFQRGFSDVTEHQVKVFSAMQMALKMLMEDLDPNAIEAGLGPDKGVSGLLANRKARLWDHYAATWRANTQRSTDGMVGLFLHYFSQSYDSLGPHGENER